ncbi:hypothetical protein BJ508DRAFT_312327 [Ascobolus immersus RN42]|uniref:Uncharacterized protein n=1 Tax=Ascobolus immersus RN42 TaxID=1160509 RepID=A0A3N4HMI2_ASCIM|nr:hypothetical protein BJ508DRAFT_312327 [Ascobolus immersus RN42]
MGMFSEPCTEVPHAQDEQRESVCRSYEYTLEKSTILLRVKRTEKRNFCRHDMQQTHGYERLPLPIRSSEDHGDDDTLGVLDYDKQQVRTARSITTSTHSSIITRNKLTYGAKHTESCNWCTKCPAKDDGDVDVGAEKSSIFNTIPRKVSITMENASRDALEIPDLLYDTFQDHGDADIVVGSRSSRQCNERIKGLPTDTNTLIRVNRVTEGVYEVLMSIKQSTDPTNSSLRLSKHGDVYIPSWRITNARAYHTT